VKQDRLFVRREGAAADANSVHELLDRVLLDGRDRRFLLLRERSGSGDDQGENKQKNASILIHGEIFLSLELGDAESVVKI